MPPKKSAVAEKKILLGRPSNNLQMGFVGVPNVGKSSLFNAISKCAYDRNLSSFSRYFLSSPLSLAFLRVTNAVQTLERLPTSLSKPALLGRIQLLRGHSSYFSVFRSCSATIEPEEARVAVPDERFESLCEIYKPSGKIPPFLTCVDIAGLTKGAASGAGLGNNFLSHVRAVDGIFQVVRAFDDADVIHVEGEVDPVRDMEVISTELRLKDIEWVEKKHELLRKALRGATGTANLADKAKKEEFVSDLDIWFDPQRSYAYLLHRQDTVSKVLDVLTVQNKDVRKAVWTNKEVEIVNELQLLTAKPVTYLINLSEKDYIRKKNKWLPKIKAWIDENTPGDKLIPFSVALEERLAQDFNDPAAQEEELKKLGTTGALGKITTAGYRSLNLIYYFTCGPQEVRAWTIREGTKAPQAAGVIHTDFEKNFICGEIFTYADIVEYGTEAGVKAAADAEGKAIRGARWRHLPVRTSRDAPPLHEAHPHSYFPFSWKHNA
ncbi:hypothetical protein P7C70_g4554, partial [Phenoliferia sp. Uapishka_3]